MTLYEFNILDDNDKYQTTWDKGVFIDSKVRKEERYVLYAINMFFVEVRYDRTTNSISDIKSFISGHRLDKYVGSISF